MKKILVANRGEIAIRIMRTAREMGIGTVAIYSEADRNALHVRTADEAVCIGPAPSAQSYLSIDRVLDAARLTKADAIHPGYGFLSENADFADRVKKAGLIFIGPTGDAMRMIGSKIAARETAGKHNIPLVPGTPGAVTDAAEAAKIAAGIGFPVLIKASAGGGGKGMRIVHRQEEFEEQMKRAVSEATSAFGDGSVFIERYVASPRHVEIQVLADTHGNVVHLFERECSVQRRHQKVVEEAPSAILTPAMRNEMGACAVRIAQACGYTSAGTVEFLLDEGHNFYFLEMNTRLQVEHPVTELITGLDLVREQINIARGQRLLFTQDDLSIRGHAIEVRVYAEDPLNDFLPDTGKLKTYRIPQGPGVRVDDGYEEGQEIPIYYDPMIAKLIAWDKDRASAIRKMIRAIDDYKISGVCNTLAFCRFVMEHEAFASGSFDTHFVRDHFSPDKLKNATADEENMAAFLAAVLAGTPRPSASNTAPRPSSAWKQNRLKDQG